MSRWKRSVLALCVAAALGATTVGCRAVVHGAATAAVVGAVTAARVVAVTLAVATWYAITQPIYVYYQPASSTYYYVPSGYRIHIISRSADGRWYYVRTQDGRYGWVDARSLRGCHRI